MRKAANGSRGLAGAILLAFQRHHIELCIESTIRAIWGSDARYFLTPCPVRAILDFRWGLDGTRLSSPFRRAPVLLIPLLCKRPAGFPFLFPWAVFSRREIYFLRLLDFCLGVHYKYSWHDQKFYITKCWSYRRGRVLALHGYDHALCFSDRASRNGGRMKIPWAFNREK